MVNRLKLFSVLDVKAGAFKPVFCVPSVGEAERAFLDVCSNDELDMGKHPEDYQLYCVGEFDEFEGTVTSTEKFHVANGMQAMAMQGHRLGPADGERAVKEVM